MWITLFIVCCMARSITSYEVIPIQTPKIPTAISPIWDDDTQSLYFIDLVEPDPSTTPAIYRYSVVDGVLYSAVIEGATQPIGYIVPVRRKCERCKNLLSVGIGHDGVLIEWDGVSKTAHILSKIYSVDANDPMSRTDIARPDRMGRLYGGSFAPTFCITPRNKTFYKYSSVKGYTPLFHDIYTTSGVAFNDETNKIYHVDVCLLLISEYDHDRKTGNICNGRIAFNFGAIGKTADVFNPLGAEIDSNGNIYTADYQQSVYVINPTTGTLVDIIDLGITGVSGMAFGGPNHDILFVTVASTRFNLLEGTVEQVITEGTSLYMVTGLGVCGPKSTSFKVE